MSDILSDLSEMLWIWRRFRFSDREWTIVGLVSTSAVLVFDVDSVAPHVIYCLARPEWSALLPIEPEGGVEGGDVSTGSQAR